MEEIIRHLQGKVDGFEILIDEVVTTTSEFRGDEPYSLDTRLTKGLGLRVIKDGRLGLVATTDFRRISELVDTLLAIAEYGERAYFSFPKEIPQTRCRLRNDMVANLSSEDIFRLGKEVITCAKAEFPEFKIDLTLTHSNSQRRIINSSGLDLTYQKVYYSLNFSGLLVDEDGLTWIYDYQNLSSGETFSVWEFVNRQVERAKDAKKKVRVMTKEYPVIFAPGFGLVEFFFPLLQGVNGKNLQKGITPLLGKEGKEIASPLLSVYDDGLIDYGLSSSPFDGEGVAKRQTPLIERGVFKNFLFDLQTAGQCGRRSTGNAVRSYQTSPQPGINNLLVLPQNGSLKEAIAKIKEGILVYELVGGGQSNVLAGDFSVGLSLGFKIEGGEIKGKVKDCMIAGNFYELIKRISKVGGEVKDLGSYYLPFIQFEDVKVVGK
jgi:PmbA protein